MMEKKRRNFMSFGVFCGLVLILVGVILFLSAQDWISDEDVLPYLLLGLGGIFLIDVIVRYAQPDRRRFLCCRLTVGLVLLSAGGAILGGIESWWFLILVVVGLGILLNALLRR